MFWLIKFIKKNFFDCKQLKHVMLYHIKKELMIKQMRFLGILGKVWLWSSEQVTLILEDEERYGRPLTTNTGLIIAMVEENPAALTFFVSQIKVLPTHYNRTSNFTLGCGWAFIPVRPISLGLVSPSGSFSLQ